MSAKLTVTLKSGRRIELSLDEANELIAHLQNRPAKVEHVPVPVYIPAPYFVERPFTQAPWRPSFVEVTC